LDSEIVKGQLLTTDDVTISFSVSVYKQGIIYSACLDVWTGVYRCTPPVRTEDFSWLLESCFPSSPTVQLPHSDVLPTASSSSSSTQTQTRYVMMSPLFDVMMSY